MERMSLAAHAVGIRADQDHLTGQRLVSMAACIDVSSPSLNAVGVAAEDVPSARLLAAVLCVACWPDRAVGRCAWVR